ncbi:MAG: hypothetical protein ABIR13_10140 [Polaromonas sp.]
MKKRSRHRQVEPERNWKNRFLQQRLADKKFAGAAAQKKRHFRLWLNQTSKKVQRPWQNAKCKDVLCRRHAPRWLDPKYCFLDRLLYEFTRRDKDAS